jgi:flagellar basal body rod protein FlgB
MLKRIMGEGSSVAMLRKGLDDSTQAVRGISHRVASVGAEPPPDGFDRALRDAEGRVDQPQEAVDLEREMVAMAREQLRFEASSALLTKVYQNLRNGIRGS